MTISGDCSAAFQQRERCKIYRQIRARQIRFFGGINLTIENELEISSSRPVEESNILAVENIADTILETNSRIPRSKLPALVLGL
jgi:hypothetical protein